MGLSEGARRNTKSGGWITHRRVTRLGSSHTCGAGRSEGVSQDPSRLSPRLAASPGRKGKRICNWAKLIFNSIWPRKSQDLKWMWPGEPTSTSANCMLRVMQQQLETNETMVHLKCTLIEQTQWNKLFVLWANGTKFLPCSKPHTLIFFQRTPANLAVFSSVGHQTLFSEPPKNQDIYLCSWLASEEATDCCRGCTFGLGLAWKGANTRMFRQQEREIYIYIFKKSNFSCF